MYSVAKLIVGMILSFILGILVTVIVIALLKMRKDAKRDKMEQEKFNAEIQRIKKECNEKMQELINEEYFEDLEIYSDDNGSNYPC